MKMAPQEAVLGYESKDFNEVSILVAHTLPYTARRNGKSIIFCFPDFETAKNLIDSYWQNTLTMNVRTFTRAQKDVREFVYNYRITNKEK